MKCPHCGNEFDPVDGQQYCHLCGGDLSHAHIPNRPAWETNRLDDKDPKLELDNGFNTEKLEYCPWEDQENLGFLTGFYLTLKQSLFNAQEFFGAMPRTNGFILPLLYALIIQTLGAMFTCFWFFTTENPLLEQLAALTSSHSIIASLAIPVLIPVVVFLGVVIWACLLHISLVIVGGANEVFEATFRVTCYSSGPELFKLVPVIGRFITLFWKIYITVIGLREIHRTSLGKAIAAVLLPMFVCCGIGLFLGISVIFTGMAFSPK